MKTKLLDTLRRAAGVARVAQYGSAEDRLALRNDPAAGAHGDAFGSGTTK